MGLCALISKNVVKSFIGYLLWQRTYKVIMKHYCAQQLISFHEFCSIDKVVFHGCLVVECKWKIKYTLIVLYVLCKILGTIVANI
jgi:hypothetical protein